MESAGLTERFLKMRQESRGVQILLGRDLYESKAGSETPYEWRILRVLCVAVTLSEVAVLCDGYK
jgi:hypothetical protein